MTERGAVRLLNELRAELCLPKVVTTYRKEAVRRYQERNKGKVRDWVKQWREANPEKYAEQLRKAAERMRAKRRAAGRPERPNGGKRYATEEERRQAAKESARRAMAKYRAKAAEFKPRPLGEVVGGWRFVFAASEAGQGVSAWMKGLLIRYDRSVNGMRNVAGYGLAFDDTGTRYKTEAEAVGAAARLFSREKAS